MPRERLELVANRDYWDPARRPHTDRLVFLPVPDASSRTAALLSGQVDWVEAPDPDSLAELKGRGFRIVTNSYPHIWGWYFSELPGSPFADVRVRQALNWGIDRDAIVALLSGTAVPADGVVADDSAWFGPAQQRYKYDPARARALLAEAGYGPAKPLAFKVLISTSGSGQMQPLPMNAALQEQLSRLGVTVEFIVLDWNTLRTRRAEGAKASDTAGAVGLNNSWTWQDPDFGLLGTSMSARVSPNGLNWGYVNDPTLDALGVKIMDTFDIHAQDALIAQFHARMVDQADWLFVVHDLNARALSPHVTGFVQARSWLQDFTSVTMR